jgi:hypothetical protein
MKFQLFGRFASYLLVISVWLINVLSLDAQGIKGRIVDYKGEALPFASIGVKGTSRGTAANVEGNFQLDLAPGKYDIRVQYLGFSHLDTTINVGSQYLTWNPSLLPEAIALPEAIVKYGKEDPAYTIMRRAIAKAKYHAMQVDEYKAMVYVKGSGRLLKVPGLFRKQINKALAEEGIDSTVAFTQESVSKLHYMRPDQYRDTVISVRTVGNDNNTSPMGFVYSSFYEPKVAAGISPLAPDAFQHYKYEYLGFITEGDQTINKIKVTPRGKGDQVFEGVIYIVDNVWSIHSVDLTTFIWGIQFDIKQRFEPQLPGVWLPVHEIYDVSGSVFGFAFEYRYFAGLSDYKIKLNPDLEVPVFVLDERKEEEESKAAEARIDENNFDNGLQQLKPNEELTTKQLRKMMRDYERQEIEALPESDTVEMGNVSQQVVDSSAYKRDSVYWAELRPMPLTDYEIRGYSRQDSIAKVPPIPGDNDNDDGDQDTLQVSIGEDGFNANVKRRVDFKLGHLVTGGHYRINDNSYVKLKGLLQTVNFNTVDGFHGGYELEYGQAKKKGLNWSIAPFVRYAVSREAVNYEGKLRLNGEDWNFRINAGNMPKQFSQDHPISPWVNSTYTLLANRNYLKQYEQTFGRASFDYRFSPAVGIELSGEYADRRRLVNNTDLVFFDSKKLRYTSNNPVFLEANQLALADHEAYTVETSVWLKPFWRYRVSQGTKRKVYDRSPMLTLTYRKGLDSGDDPFDFIMADFDYKFQVGAGSVLSMHVNAGKFTDSPDYFANYAHFPGSRLINTPFNPVQSFRMLDYYLHSTREEYAYGLFNYQFRRFALTQIDHFRRSGIRENLIYNVLVAPTSDEYMEVGYAINYVFRFLRVEFLTSWQDYKYQDFAVRIGVATDFKSLLGGL